MKSPERFGESQELFEIGGRSHGEQAPAFAEPWQASVFAMAVQLHAKGVFGWSEWASALSSAIKAGSSAGALDDSATGYGHWVSALETLIGHKNLATREEMDARQAAWALAYRATPHGHAVDLSPSSGQGPSPAPLEAKG